MDVMTEWDFTGLADGPSLCVREWGSPLADRPPVVILHGFLEQSAAWDEVAEQLSGRVLAPDQRGHGLSGHAPPGASYWFWDYVADLDALVDHLGGPVDLVGHSMGGSVAVLFAGARPERVRRLVLVEGLGPPESGHEALPRGRKFLEARRVVPEHRVMRDVHEAVERIRRANPNIPAPVAQRLASRTVKPVPGGVVWTWDPRHRARSPYPFRADTFGTFLAAVTAPTLVIDGGASPFALPDAAERLANLRACTRATIEGAGHLVHHDRPAALASAIEVFLS